MLLVNIFPCISLRIVNITTLQNIMLNLHETEEICTAVLGRRGGDRGVKP